MANRAVDFQFWLNVGSPSWWERLFQPLTHPYVLGPRWPDGGIWTDVQEFESRQESLHRLTLGLIRRCRCQVYLVLCERGEQGGEEKGQLLHTLHQILRGEP